MSSLTDACRARLQAGEKPDKVWDTLRRHLESLTLSELSAQAVELEACAGHFPDEVRWVSSENYCVMTEVDTGSREGSEWKFENFLSEPKPCFRFARHAAYNFDNGVRPLLDFAGRRQIRHWQFDNLRYRSAAELAEVFTPEYFRESSGAALSWLDAGNDAYFSLFKDARQWQHWQALSFSWLRDEKFSAVKRWIDLLAETSVRRFSMQSCTIGETGYRALVEHDFIARLEELELLNVYLGNAECRILINGKYQPRRLKRLNLEDCILSSGKPEMDGATFVDFIQSAFFSCLEDLENRYHVIGPEGMAALVRSPSRLTMRYLSLHNSRLGDAGLKVLFDNVWPALREIYISYDTFSAATLNWVKQTPLFGQCPEVAVFPMDGEHIYKTVK